MKFGYALNLIIFALINFFQESMANVRYPIGIQSFPKLREGNFIYVDKTRQVYELAESGQYIFLSRPRRFGKSLLLSTLQAYFEGKRELFEGLDIMELEKHWMSYPVLMLSLASFSATTENSLDSILSFHFDDWEKKYGVTNIYTDSSMRLRNIVKSAYEATGKKVVVLIDEYDAPLVTCLGDEEKYEILRDRLKSIYSCLKDMDGYIQFGMLTGVTRFSKMTVFSGLNNLKDISLDPRFDDICGITEAELESYFSEGIKDFAEALDTDYDGALSELKKNYDGYHFTESLTDIYNPFSLMQALDFRRIGLYWFVSGTPAFLVRQIKDSGSFLPEFFNETVAERVLSETDIYKSSPISLLFQTGYLTIKGYDRRRNRYTLGVPNVEVKTGLFEELSASLMFTDHNEVSRKVWDMRDEFGIGNPDKALKILKSFLAGIPYELTADKPEIYFENNLYLIFNLIGIDAHAEWHTSDGRIDMVLIMDDYIYVIELKLDRTADDALRQIEKKDYALPFQNAERQIIKIGINFSSRTRNIDSWIISE